MKSSLVSVILLIATSLIVRSQVVNDTIPSFSDCTGEITVPGTEITSKGYPDKSPSSLDCWVDIR